MMKNTDTPTLESKILRGKDKIGENLIEITYGDTKILVELGKQLEPDETTIDNNIALEQAILHGDYTAVVVSHYHEDHAGLIYDKRDCPIYIGKGARTILKAKCEYLKSDFPKNLFGYSNMRPFKIGAIKVTPYLCDHSAYDSYMLLFEAGGRSILYTGDFRFHGRKNKDKLLSALPRGVDELIHEGTNIGKPSPTFSESALEDKALKIMQATDGPVFVLSSSTNIDRIVSIYRASKRNGRLTYMDNFTCIITAAAGGSIPRPDEFKDVVAYTPTRLFGNRKDMFFEITKKRGLKAIAAHSSHYTMFVRKSMLPYIKKLFSVANYTNATLIYSIWQGYKKEEQIAEFLESMQSLGVKIIDLHTSGHASEQDIELLKSVINAKEVKCVHTQI